MFDEFEIFIKLQVATLWDEEFQTITLHQANSELNNYEVIVAKPNDENDTSNICISTAQEDSGTFVNFVNDYNDREDPTQPKKEITVNVTLFYTFFSTQKKI